MKPDYRAYNKNQLSQGPTTNLSHVELQMEQIAFDIYDGTIMFGIKVV